MNAVQCPEGQELQKLGSGAWDNPAYIGAPSPRGTPRICTISSEVPPPSQPKKPEDGPQEKAHKTLVSSCCLQICRGIRGTWWGRVLLRYWSEEKGSTEAVGREYSLKKRWNLSVSLGFVNGLR